MPNRKEKGRDKQDTSYEETMSAIGLQGTVDTTYGDSMSMRASNMLETMRSSRATSTPSGGQSFEGFVPMSYPVRHGNQIYFGDHYDDTDHNIGNTGEIYDSQSFWRGRSTGKINSYKNEERDLYSNRVTRSVQR